MNGGSKNECMFTVGVDKNHQLESRWDNFHEFLYNFFLVQSFIEEPVRSCADLHPAYDLCKILRDEAKYWKATTHLTSPTQPKKNSTLQQMNVAVWANLRWLFVLICILESGWFRLLPRALA